MKSIKKLSLLCFISIASACIRTNHTVSGIYVMSFKNEFSIATDTLIISAFNLSAGIYEVERRDGFHRLRQGKILPKEFRQERWMATYDKNKQILIESTYGRIIYIKEEARYLSYGGDYQKIK